MKKQQIKNYLRFLRFLFKVNCGLLKGMWKITKVPQPAITFFGGSHLSKDDIITKKIGELAERLAHAGFSIITGGGPGLMEAANKGAFNHAREHEHLSKSHVSLGIGLANLKQENNKFTHDFILQPYFLTRKLLLVRYSVGFVVGPGGFGTLDELTEVITLLQAHNMPSSPLVLMGKNFWDPFFEWIKDKPLFNNLIQPNDLALFTITDDVEEALTIITTHCTNCPHGGSLESSSREIK